MKFDYNLKKKKKPKTEYEAQCHPYQYAQKPEFKYETMTDAEGLRRAYEHGDYYIHGKTMYIASSHTARDWFDDFTKIPFYGDLRDSERYQKAYEAFRYRGEIDNVVGHSLGGAVTLEMQKNYPDRIKTTRTYGAPVFNLMGTDSETAERYRHWLDPFSMLDRSATSSIKWNPLDSVSLTHDYKDLGDKFERTEKIPIEDDEEDS